MIDILHTPASSYLVDTWLAVAGCVLDCGTTLNAHPDGRQRAHKQAHHRKHGGSPQRSLVSAPGLLALAGATYRSCGPPGHEVRRSMGRHTLVAAWYVMPSTIHHCKHRQLTVLTRLAKSPSVMTLHYRPRDPTSCKVLQAAFEWKSRTSQRGVR